MRNTTPLLACVSGLILAMGAGAETYSVLAGAITDAENAVAEPLTGAFDAGLFEPDTPSDPQTRTVLIDDFAFQAGARSFLPRQAIEFEGLTPTVYIEIADQIQLDGDAVAWLRLRSGGNLLEANGDEATFRYLEFRSGGSGGGLAVGSLPESGLPRRFQLRGTLHEVDQTFRIHSGDCLLPLRPRPPGGGGIQIGTLGGVFVSLPTLDVDPAVPVEFQRPAGGGVQIGRVTGGAPGSIGGALLEGGSAYLVAPPGAALGRISGASSEAPVLPASEELGIVTAIADDASASDGARVPADPGMPPLIGLPFCDGLRPLFPADEHEVGSFWLIASAARPVEIDVQPWRRQNRLQLGSRQMIPLAVLGSSDLDVRDVDEGSLRLGPGEAEPLAWRGRSWILRLDVNRDRRLDLLAFFDIRDTGIAFGATAVCLVAETHDGAIIEGCDAIDTWPGRNR